MIQQQVYIINTILMMLDAACIIVSSYIAYFLTSHGSGGVWSMDKMSFAVTVLLAMIINNHVMGSLNLYGERRPVSYARLIIEVSKSILIDFVVLFAIVFLIRQLDISRDFLLNFGATSLALILFERLVVQYFLKRQSQLGFSIQKILIVGDKFRGSFVKTLLENQLSWGHQVLEIFPVRDSNGSSGIDFRIEDDLENFLRKNPVDEVVFAFDADRAIKLSGLLELCAKIGVRTKILPALWDPKGKTLSTEWVQGVPFLTLQSDNFNAIGLFYKRLLDLIGGVIGATIFIILYPFVALVIKLDSPGPVIFKQQRVGQHGRKFNLYKFRSMYQNAETMLKDLEAENEMKGAMFKITNDPRVTRVGKWLRKSSIDEFPQFLNVLKGEMSLVGTRPPTLLEVEKYDLWHLKRIAAKPGITGMWQISGRNRIDDFNKVVELDCQYLENWKISDDIRILFKTIWVVLQRKGAV